MNLPLLSHHLDAIALYLIDKTQQAAIERHACTYLSSRVPELVSAEQVLVVGTNSLTWLNPGSYRVGDVEAALAGALSVEAADPASSSGFNVYADRVSLYDEAFYAGYAAWLSTELLALSPATHGVLQEYANEKKLPIQNALLNTKGIEVIASRARTALSCCKMSVQEALPAVVIDISAEEIRRLSHQRFLAACRVADISIAAQNIFRDILSRDVETDVLVSKLGADEEFSGRGGTKVLLFSLDSLGRVSLYGLSAVDVMRRVKTATSLPCGIFSRPSQESGTLRYAGACK